jgi:hypothetical protein
MIQKDICDITFQDIQDLAVNSVSERKTIDYKRELLLNSDKQKGEFLADISSFANTAGGDLIIGVEEKNSIPQSMPGIPLDNIDSEILKAESIIREGIQPRVRTDARSIPITEDKKSGVLIIRVHKSWNQPHRVIFKPFSKTKNEFYARSSNGKYQLDLDDLRSMFSASGTLAETIRDFHQKRIFHITSEDTPIPISASAKIILHICPLESFSPGFSVNMAPIIDNLIKMPPMYESGWRRCINLEGVITYSGGDKDPYSYTQLYRNGVLEAVDSGMLGFRYSDNDAPTLLSRGYEEKLREALSKYLDLLQQISINPPLFIFLGLMGVKGYFFGVSSEKRFIDDDGPLNRENIFLPEAYVPTYDVDIDEILRPLFDMVWNAWGYRRSLNYDSSGKWNPA